eukprot:365948-Chlamydomonas_euryale.AAC.22
MRPPTLDSKRCDQPSSTCGGKRASACGAAANRVGNCVCGGGERCDQPSSNLRGKKGKALLEPAGKKGQERAARRPIGDGNGAKHGCACVCACAEQQGEGLNIRRCVWVYA